MRNERLPLNTELIKKLAVGGDDPMVAMGKYKDPTLFQPQMLLAFFAQAPPQFPQRDGGLRSRLSYLFMPLEFVAAPEPGTNQRALDTSIKLKVNELIPELLLWLPLLVQGLMASRSRVVLPRPEKVCDDTDYQYMEQTSEGKQDAKEFIEKRIAKWTRDCKPATRTEIDRAFTQAHPGAVAKEVLPIILHSKNPVTNAPFNVRFGGDCFAVYRAYFKGDELSADGELCTVTLRT